MFQGRILINLYVQVSHQPCSFNCGLISASADIVCDVPVATVNQAHVWFAHS